MTRNGKSMAVADGAKMGSGSGGGAVFEGDMFADDVLANSHETFRTLREMGPVVWLAQHETYAVARYEDVVAGLRAHDQLISGQGVSMNAMLNGENMPTGTSTITSDGQAHLALKRLEMRPLMPAAVNTLRQRLVDHAEAMVDELATGTPFDAMATLASCLPIRVVADLVGIKGVGPEQMLQWSGAVFDAFGPAHHTRTGAAYSVIQQFVEFGSRLTRADVEPGSWADGIFAAVETGEVTLEVARDLIFDYVLPSLDTTIYATGEMLYQLARMPGSLNMLRARPDLANSIIYESVRLASPLRGFTRLASHGFTFSNTAIPAGSRVWLLYASANRDERKFRDPDCFDPERNPRDNLGWGHGAHMCSGMHLARLEMAVMLQVLASKVRHMEVGQPTRIINNSAQGYATLPMALKAGC